MNSKRTLHNALSAIQDLGIDPDFARITVMSDGEFLTGAWCDSEILDVLEKEAAFINIAVNEQNCDITAFIK